VPIEFLKTVFRAYKDKDAIVWRDRTYDYGWLFDRIGYWDERIQGEGIRGGTVTVVEGNFSPNSIALFLALAERRCVILPLTSSLGAKKAEFVRIAQGEVAFELGDEDDVEVSSLPSSSFCFIWTRWMS